MPNRHEPFITGYVYHVFNKTIEGKRIFAADSYCDTFMNRARYYRSKKATISFSFLPRLQEIIRSTLLRKVEAARYFQIEILAYCFMPTHFHFLLKQRLENGIQKFIGNLTNSFSHFYNLKNERAGPLFLPKFKSVRVRSDEQLMHVARYIHLNPYSGGLIKDIAELDRYQWSSFKEYLQARGDKLSNDTDVLSLFHYNRQRYKRFVYMNADYQKSLEYTKHVEKW